tara:strand:- start:11626 stop:11769 length:144 start_codon:yes stop_codon:yes gene_type:complete
MIKKEIAVNGVNLLILGITFKENCPDVSNAKIAASLLIVLNLIYIFE